jgi:hypothetical protein
MSLTPRAVPRIRIVINELIGNVFRGLCCIKNKFQALFEWL